MVHLTLNCRVGSGIQTGLQAIKDGRIGQPLTALAIMQSPGPESWHLSPEFLFDAGAGPLFDIGPPHAPVGFRYSSEDR